MVADVLTKPLSYEAFARHSSYMKGAIFLEMKEGEARSFQVSTRLKDLSTKRKGPTDNGTLDSPGAIPYN